MNPQTWLTSVAITFGVAIGAHWDDETFLGRGPLAAAGLAVPLGEHVSAEGELGLGRHHRDAGYLIADGTPVLATGRVSYAFTRRNAPVRPFVSGGVTWLHTTGHFMTPAGRTDWRSSTSAWELGTGAEIRATDHVSWRPEARWTLTPSDPNHTPGSLEPPLFVIRGGVTVLWR